MHINIIMKPTIGCGCSVAGCTAAQAALASAGDPFLSSDLEDVPFPGVKHRKANGSAELGSSKKALFKDLDDNDEKMSHSLQILCTAQAYKFVVRQHAGNSGTIVLDDLKTELNVASCLSSSKQQLGGSWPLPGCLNCSRYLSRRWLPTFGDLVVVFIVLEAWAKNWCCLGWLAGSFYPTLL